VAGLGFGAKEAAPAVSLGALFLACQFADLLWPLGASLFPGRRRVREHLRSAAAERVGGRVVRAGHLAAVLWGYWVDRHRHARV
jgi:hypothetical protein